VPNEQPRNIINDGEPSRTALRVATLRAAHQLLDEPILLADPVALPILGAELEAQVREDPYQYNDTFLRALRASVVLRSKIVEDEVARGYAAGIRQYVVLGAGLDTFAYRNPYPDLCVFEVDHPSTQQWKKRSLESAEIPLPDSLRFVATDFERGTLLKELAAVGFDETRPACFSWLGVTMYLTEAAVMETLTLIARLPRESSVTFDFRLRRDLMNPFEQAIAPIVEQHVAALGEPWISAFDPTALSDSIRALGFQSAEAHDPEEFNRRYLYRRKDGLRANLRLLHAVV
jgi:methyltransferase (TIGR00027 family)